MFIGFVNFYQCFIKGFSKIVALITYLLKITTLSKELAPKVFWAKNNRFISNDGSRTNKIFVSLSKNLMYILNIKLIVELILLTPNAKKVFNHLK